MLRAMVATGLWLAVLAPAPGTAQEDPFAGWHEPVLTGVEVRVERPDGRWKRVRPGDRITVPMGGSRVLEVRGEDQWRREFPPERSAFALEPERGAEELVRVTDLGDGRFRIQAGDRKGDGRLVLWAANNLNLAWRFRVRVVGPEADGYSRGEAEVIARRLYRALLGREPDPQGFSAAVAEIQRGRLDSQVKGMLASSEFQVLRHRLSDTALLEQIYAGLLDREPDSDGVRDYLPRIRRRRTAEVVLRILRSDEFARLLLRDSRRRRPHRR